MRLRICSEVEDDESEKTLMPWELSEKEESLERGETVLDWRTERKEWASSHWM